MSNDKVQSTREAFEAWAMEYHEHVGEWTGTRYRDTTWEEIWLAFKAGLRIIFANDQETQFVSFTALS